MQHTILKKYRWSSAFLLLASLQAICTLALLTPTLDHVRKIYYETKREKTSGNISSADNSEIDELFDKAFKISGEYVMFLVFEVWRVWLAIDGVRKQNKTDSIVY